MPLKKLLRSGQDFLSFGENVMNLEVIKRHLLNSENFSRISVSAPLLFTNTSSSENCSSENKCNEMFLDCTKDRELAGFLEEWKNHEPSIKY